MKKILFSIILGIILSSCIPAKSPTQTGFSKTTVETPSSFFTSTALPSPSLTQTPTLTVSPTLTPTPTPTITNTYTPTIQLPVLAGTPLPSLSSIQENSRQARLITQFGKGTVHSLKLSPDRKTLLAVTTAGVILYDSITMEEKSNFYTENAMTAAISPDGNYLAIGTDWISHGVNIIRLADKKTVKRIEGEKDQGWTSVPAFSPDGNTFAVGEEKQVTIYRMSDWSVLHVVKVNSWILGDPFSPLNFSPDGLSLLISIPPKFNLIEVSTGKLLWEGYGGPAVFSPDGRTIASMVNGQIFLWDAHTFTKKLLPGDFSCWGFLHDLQFSSDSQDLITTTDCNTLKIWRVSDTKLLQTLKSKNELKYVTFSGDDQEVIAAADIKNENRQNLLIWRRSDGELVNSITGFLKKGPFNADYAFARSIAFSPDNKILACSLDGKFVWLWRVSDGTLVKIIPSKEAIAEKLAFSPDGRFFAVGNLVYETKGWTLLKDIFGKGIPLFSEDSKLLYLVGAQGTQVWDLYGSSIRLIKMLSSVRTLYGDVEISPDGKTFVTTNCDLVCSFGTDGTSKLKFLSSASDITISPNGEYVASVNNDYAILWQLQSGNQIRNFQAEKPERWMVGELAFSPNSQILAVGRQLFDVSNSTPIITFDIDPHSINTLAFSPDGKLFAVGTRDGIVYIYGVIQ